MIDFDWRRAFSEKPVSDGSAGRSGKIGTLAGLKEFLDEVHVRECLLRPYGENEDYPYVLPSELMPSFENELWEYGQLPGFSMVAFDRRLASFVESFQYDILDIDDSADPEGGDGTASAARNTRNMQTVSSRLPRKLRESFFKAFSPCDDITSLASYPAMLSFLQEMDRAQVIAKNAAGEYALAGVFASFPSDFNGELKRFGLQIGRFRIGDSAMYERNRMFVIQFLMELYGFPIASERRTSSALFARKLFRAGERFIIRVLGQSDRTISTIWSDGTGGHTPHIEKWALVRLPKERADLYEYLERNNAFVDTEKRVVLLHLQYRQHAYHATNIRQDRALSIEKQTVVHPLTGERLEGLNVIRWQPTILLTLNDIIRGEYFGRIVYHRTELIVGTDGVDKRLKALSAWLTKNQRYMISAEDGFFSDIAAIMNEYLASEEVRTLPAGYVKIRREIETCYMYILQARQVQAVVRLAGNEHFGGRRNTAEMFQSLINVMTTIGERKTVYSRDLASQWHTAVRKVLNDPYTRHKYLTGDESRLSAYGRRVRSLHAEAVGLYEALCAEGVKNAGQ